MNARSQLLLPVRRKRLAGIIATLFGIAVPAGATALPHTWPVTSCNDDDDPGTLRNVIAAASTVSGDTVDLSALNCPGSKITLAPGGGNIVIAQNSLTLYGDGVHRDLAIDGSQVDPTFNVLSHIGLGTLEIRYLVVTGGHVNTQDPARGGCVYSAANVTLAGSSIVSCSAYGQGGAQGGGIFANGNVSVSNSRVTGNSASGAPGAAGGGIWARGNIDIGAYTIVSANSVSSPLSASGGGLYTSGNLSLYETTVSSNSAMSAGSYALAGGAYVAGNFSTIYSTISANSANGHDAVGGLLLKGVSNTISDSTISGNTATASDSGFGGIAVASGGFRAATKFYNATIAFNSANTAPGVAFIGAMAVTLQSTLMSNNGGGPGGDLSVVGSLVTFNGGNVAAAANNLIRVTSVGNLPADTLTGSCPLLAPLSDNGGVTATHALHSRSPAIDKGNNVRNLNEDQRRRIFEPGQSPRVSGPSADIGAFEVKQNFVIFDAGFDGC